MSKKMQSQHCLWYRIHIAKQCMIHPQIEKFANIWAMGTQSKWKQCFRTNDSLTMQAGLMNERKPTTLRALKRLLFEDE